MSGVEKYTELVADSIIENELDSLKEMVNGEITMQELYERFWTNDSITGNASGSYYCNAYKAEEDLCHCFDLIGQMVEEGFVDTSKLTNPEYLDVSARCYVLGEAIALAQSIYENNVELQEIERGGVFTPKGSYKKVTEYINSNTKPKIILSLFKVEQLLGTKLPKCYYDKPNKWNASRNAGLLKAVNDSNYYVAAEDVDDSINQLEAGYITLTRK